MLNDATRKIDQFRVPWRELANKIHSSRSSQSKHQLRIPYLWWEEF